MMAVYLPGGSARVLSTKKSVREGVSFAGSSNIVTRAPEASSTAPKIVSAPSAAMPAEKGT